MAKRIQRRRTKGWRMPAHAVYVGRPTKWGNPFTIAGAISGGFASADDAQRFVTDCFRAWLKRDDDGIPGCWDSPPARREKILASLDELRGRDLACWCALDEPCHADTLLVWANRRR